MLITKIYDNYRTKENKIYNPKSKNPYRLYEKDLQKQAEQLLRLLVPIPQRGFWYHPNEKERQGFKGLPDIIGHLKNDKGICPFYIELKVGANQPSAHQRVTMKILDDSGYTGSVCYTVKDVEAFLKDINVYV